MIAIIPAMMAMAARLSSNASTRYCRKSKLGVVPGILANSDSVEVGFAASNTCPEGVVGDCASNSNLGTVVGIKAGVSVGAGLGEGDGVGVAVGVVELVEIGVSVKE